MQISEPTSVIETPDFYGAFPRLSEQEVAMLSPHGVRRSAKAGDVLFREGDRCGDFFVIIAGKAAVIQEDGDEQRTVAIHGQRRFLGELGVLSRQISFLTTIMVEDGEVLAVPVNRLQSVVAEDPILGDLILRAYLIRRSLLIGQGAGFRIVGSRFSPDTHRLREFVARNRLPHRFLDVEHDEEAEVVLRELGVTPAELPIVVWRGREVLRNPDLTELAGRVGLTAPMFAENHVNDLVIVGAGPAGLAASVYGASEGLSTVLLEAVATGGQAASSERIENYLGFPSGISGADLTERAVLQAEKFGARISVLGEAAGLDQVSDHYGLRLRDGSTAAARAVIIATGARYRKLDVPELERFERTSVYYAATKLEVRSCADIEVAVVGGGNSAGQAALALAKDALRVRLVVRGDNLLESMSRYLVDRIQHHSKVQVLTCWEVRELIGDATLRALVLENNRSGQRETVPANALFVFIGAHPRTKWLANEVMLDDRGFVLTGDQIPPRAGLGLQRRALLETSIPGIYAAGDVRSGSIKRLASAVGEGSMAVRLVHHFLEHNAEF